jgi:hypothetical protein
VWLSLSKTGECNASTQFIRPWDKVNGGSVSPIIYIYRERENRYNNYIEREMSQSKLSWKKMQQTRSVDPEPAG